MNTLTPKIIRKFRPVFAVQEYQELMAKYRWGKGNWMTHRPGAKEEYWNKLPEYVLSKCPICGAEHTDWLDLHSLVMGGIWVDKIIWTYKRNILYRSCEHGVAMALFLHLNDNKVDEIASLQSEVPFLTDFLFPKEIKESFAVINAFPLCRIINDQFVPAYTLFIIKYYGANPRTLTKLRNLPPGEWVNPPFLYSVNEAWEHRKDKVFDLEYWVEQGRLFWVDEENGKIVLRNNPKDFPYTGIEGFVDTLVFQDGHMQVVEHECPPRYYPTWKPKDWTKKQIQRLHSQRYRVPLPGCRYILIILATLLIVAIVTSLFFRPIIDPVVAWMLMLLGLGTAAYFTIQANYRTYKDRHVTRRAFMRKVVIDLTGLLLTTGAAILAGGWAVRVVGLLILRVTNLAWLGVILGMLAGFAAGFGVAWLVRWVWQATFKRGRQSSTASK